MHLRSTRAYWPAFGVVLAAGAYVNFRRIGVPVALRDEVTYARAGWRYVHGQTSTVLPPPPFANADNFEHPPLAKYLFGLAQLVAGHPSLVAERVVAAISLLLTAVVVARWLAGAGRAWEGLVAVALILLLPQVIAPQTTRFGVDAFLDNVAVVLVVVGVVVSYRWAQARRGRRDWLWAAALGLTVGLAAATKENAFLGAVGPVILLVARRSDWRGRLVGLGQAAASATVAAAVFVLAYLPVGEPFDRIDYLLDFQSGHSARGHPVLVAGRSYEHAPWWANVWFAGHALGPVAATLLVVFALAGAALAFRTVLVQWTLAALAAPFVFHCFVAGVVLPFYWVLWMPLFCVLPAVGAGELARRARIGGVRHAVITTEAVRTEVRSRAPQPAHAAPGPGG